MDFRLYLVGLLIVAVLTYALRRTAAGIEKTLTVTPRRILVCCGWAGRGPPPAVGRLMAKASYKSRLSFAICCKETHPAHAAQPLQPLRFVVRNEFAGPSVAHQLCMTLSQNEELVLTIDPNADAVYGWDTQLERALSDLPPQSVLTHALTPSFVSTFPRLTRIGARGVHTTSAPRRAHDAAVRVLMLDEAFTFGPRERMKSLAVHAPSRVTSATAASWQLHCAGWKFYAPARAVFVLDGAPVRAETAWHVDSGVTSDAAAGFRTFADLADDGTPGPRAQLGIVDAHDEAECRDKHDSMDRVRAILGRAHEWPAVARVQM